MRSLSSFWRRRRVGSTGLHRKLRRTDDALFLDPLWASTGRPSDPQHARCRGSLSTPQARSSRPSAPSSAMAQSSTTRATWIPILRKAECLPLPSVAPLLEQSVFSDPAKGMCISRAEHVAPPGSCSAVPRLAIARTQTADPNVAVPDIFAAPPESILAQGTTFIETTIAAATASAEAKLAALQSRLDTTAFSSTGGQYFQAPAPSSPSTPPAGPAVFVPGACAWPA